jgi:prepilin-type N-terminal cleavage/methylation domain-containing protein
MAAQRERGSTLIELLITIIVVGIIAGIIGAVMLQGVRAFMAQDTKASITSQGRLAIERMARDIRLIRSRTAADIPVMTATTLSFVDTSGNAVVYTSGAGSVTRNGVALASPNATGLTFTYLKQDGTPALAATDVWVIQVDLTFAGTNESQDFRVRVHPRNFT